MRGVIVFAQNVVGVVVLVSGIIWITNAVFTPAKEQTREAYTTPCPTRNGQWLRSATISPDGAVTCFYGIEPKKWHRG